jgi:osmotically-inducible protein OsmY
MKNDREIQHDVLAALDSDPIGAGGAIGVEVHHGVVKLSGRVGNVATKKSAETIASGVVDVSTVVMDVDVAGAATARPA